jgi:arylsulfatase
MGGKPVFRYTFFDIADVTIQGAEDLPQGKVALKTDFTPDGSSEGGGVLKLFVNDRIAGEGRLTRSSFRHGLEPFEVGRDSITPIDPAYKGRGDFAFTGTIERVVAELKPEAVGGRALKGN